jgi:hypothetical protein
MRKSDLLRTFLLGLAFTTALPGQVDAREIIRRAVAADELNWKAARNYTFLQRVELRWLDAQGKVKLSHVQTYDVTLQEGTPYRQLVQKEDSALSPSGQRVIPQRRESGARAPREEYRRAPTRDRREFGIVRSDCTLRVAADVRGHNKSFAEESWVRTAAFESAICSAEASASGCYGRLAFSWLKANLIFLQPPGRR